MDEWPDVFGEAEVQAAVEKREPELDEPDSLVEDAADAAAFDEVHRVVDVKDQEVGDQGVVVIRKREDGADLKKNITIIVFLRRLDPALSLLQ